MDTHTRHDPTRKILAAHGTQLEARSWLTEAPLRMLRNNLDPEVAERPGDLVVYGGIGRANARRCAARLNRELKSRAALGDLGALLRA